jgi:hypothetical protein
MGQTQQKIGTRAASDTLRKISEYAKFCSREILWKKWLGNLGSQDERRERIGKYVTEHGNG